MTEIVGPKKLDNSAKDGNRVEKPEDLPSWHNTAHEEQQRLLRENLGDESDQMPDWMKGLTSPTTPEDNP